MAVKFRKPRSFAGVAANEGRVNQQKSEGQLVELQVCGEKWGRQEKRIEDNNKE